MKILERIVDGLNRQLVSIDDSQFGFVPGRGTADAIFVVKQLQEKYLAANKRLYMVIVDLEKAFDRVPQKVIWWALRKLGVEEWIVRLVQGMYANARVRVGEGYSEEFEVKVGVQQGSVLTPLLFIIVLEALSWEFCSGVPWEDLYADDLVIIAESLEECVRRLLTWKEAMEKKGLRVNAGKTTIMICCMGLNLLQSSGEFLCAVCRTGVGSNSIFCNGCKHWVHKKCSGHKHMKKDPDYRCTQCQRTACLLDGRPQKEVQVGPDKLEVVAFFCYLGDMFSAAGDCELSTTTSVKTAWKKFKDLLPVLSSRHLSFKTRGRVYSSCVQSAMLHASETGPLTKPNLQRLQRNDRTMIRQICNVRLQDIVTPGPVSYLCGLALRIWTSFWRREDSDGIWTCGTLQWCSQDSLWHTGWWKAWAWEAQDDMETADREGLQRVEALGHQPSWKTYLEIWCEICHACSKPAIWKGAHWCACCPCTCMLIKNPIMIIYDKFTLSGFWPRFHMTLPLRARSFFMRGKGNVTLWLLHFLGIFTYILVIYTILKM